MYTVRNKKVGYTILHCRLTRKNFSYDTWTCPRGLQIFPSLSSLQFITEVN